MYMFHITYYLYLCISASNWYTSCTKHKQLVCHPATHPWLRSFVLLKADHLFDQHLLESVMLLVHVWPNVHCSVTGFVVSIWNCTARVLATLLLTLSFALNWNLIPVFLWFFKVSYSWLQCTFWTLQSGHYQITVLLYYYKGPCYSHHGP